MRKICRVVGNYVKLHNPPLNILVQVCHDSSLVFLLIEWFLYVRHGSCSQWVYNLQHICNSLFITFSPSPPSLPPSLHPTVAPVAADTLFFMFRSESYPISGHLFRNVTEDEADRTHLSAGGKVNKMLTRHDAGRRTCMCTVGHRKAEDVDTVVQMHRGIQSLCVYRRANIGPNVSRLWIESSLEFFLAL